MYVTRIYFVVGAVATVAFLSVLLLFIAAHVQGQPVRTYPPIHMDRFN